MPLPANLFWTHPTGDASTVRCTHYVKQHENDGFITVPCTHPPVRQHEYHMAFGRRIECRCWVPPHPGGDQQPIECGHLVPQHPNGDPGPEVPCQDPLKPVSYEFSGNLIFYTDNAEVRTAAITAVSRLRALGIDVLNPRPLHIFHRDPINGKPDDPTDPFWSKYHNIPHAIQITRGSLKGEALADVLYHEMGHALLGHQCVRIEITGDPHAMCIPQPSGSAMSEGWAHFVAMAIKGRANYEQFDFENRMACVDTDPNADIEYFVACCLWDLFDPTGEDSLQLPFKELFKVYSPTLQTLANGPIINGINNYLDRLKQNNPSKTNEIEQVRIANLLTPQQRSWGWCNKCQGLFYVRNGSTGRCPAGAGHSNAGSFEYFLVHDQALRNGQDNWRWCRKCEGLFFAGNSTTGLCPAGGTHDSSGSWNYSLHMNVPSMSGQRNWRWCNKCQGLFFAGNPSQGVCKAGGTHNSSGSGDYSVRFI